MMEPCLGREGAATEESVAAMVRGCEDGGRWRCGPAEVEEGDGCWLCHLDGWMEMRWCALPVAKARVVLMASGRVETVRLTLTCRDTVHSPISFFSVWHEVTLQLISNQNDTGTCRMEIKHCRNVAITSWF